MKDKISLFLILPILFLTLLFTSCNKNTIITSDTTFALDTIVQINVYHKDAKQDYEGIINQSFGVIDDLENKLSVHIDESEIYQIKESAGKQPVTVSNITYKVIQDSIHYSEMTKGLFDVTAGPLIDLWAIDPPFGYVPTEEELETALSLIDYQNIQLDEKNSQVFLQNEDMIINLGAIAKGAIADQVKLNLLKNGVKSGLINLGGNVLLIGNKPDGSDFSVGVQDPFDTRGAYLMIIPTKDTAVVSSGDYERFFVYEGETYHHILDTNTGYPSINNIKQVTIVAPTSIMADALSTSVLLLGIQDGLALLDSIEEAEAVFITKDKKVYYTDGLKEQMVLSKKVVSEFTMVEDRSELYE